jgi:hypothetical protein
MSRQVSPSIGKIYGLQRVARIESMQNGGAGPCRPG